MPIRTLQEAPRNALVQLFEDTDEVQLDSTRDGLKVSLPIGTYLTIQCTSLPGVVQVKIEDGDYVGRIAFIPCRTEYTQ